MLLRFSERVDDGEPVTTLTLPLELRVKGRLRVTLDDGQEAGLFLDRGPILRDGDKLREAGGQVIEVRAAPEKVSVATCTDEHLFARACYHLGNRHTPLEIRPLEARYLHDHVLDAMLVGLGLSVTTGEYPFEPEPGAYGEMGTGAEFGGHSHAH